MGTTVSKYKVTPIQQPTDISCWATATAMILNARTVGSNLTPLDVAKMGPSPEYWGKYFGEPDVTNPVGGGLPVDKESEFLANYSLTGISPASYTADWWHEKLNKNGPIVVYEEYNDTDGYTTALHAVVVVSMKWNGKPDLVPTKIGIVDPFYGKEFNLNFSVFRDNLYDGLLRFKGIEFPEKNPNFSYKGFYVP